MDKLADAERDKYARMWDHPDYGHWSPGYDAVQLLTNYVAMLPGSSFTDYGAGNCKAAIYMAKKGFKVQVVDIALTHACKNLAEVRDKLKIRIFEQCLWSLRGVEITDYALCADVMEHIPEEKVDKVLKSIAGRTEKVAAFTICHEPDGCGKRIGEVLHLTVKPSDWWKAKLDKLFASVTAFKQHSGTFYLCRK